MHQTSDTARLIERGRDLMLAVVAAVGLCAALAGSAQAQAPEDKALGRPAGASSYEERGEYRYSACRETGCLPGFANDGNPLTRWGSDQGVDNQFWQVDLGGVRRVDTVRLTWQRSYAARYLISTSGDGAAFTTVADVDYPEDAGVPGRDPGEAVPVTTRFPAVSARFVRVTGLRRATGFGISLWSAEVFGPPDVTPAPAPPGPQPTPGAPTSPPPPAPTPPSAGGPRALPLITPIPVVRIRGTLSSIGARVQLFTVRAPRGTRVAVRCSGRGCPRRGVRARSRNGLVRFKQFERHLRAGVRLEVYVTRRGRLGKYTRFSIRGGRAPARRDMCVNFGSRRPRACPTA